MTLLERDRENIEEGREARGKVEIGREMLKDNETIEK